MESACLALDYEPPTKRTCTENKVTASLQCHLKSHLSSHSEQLFSEICTLQQRLASHQQAEEEKDEENCNWSDLPDLLESALSDADHAGTVLSPEACVHRLLDVIKREDQLQKNCLLSSEQRVRLEVVMTLFKALKEQQPSRWSELVGPLTKECLPIEVIWQLHANHLLSLQTTFDRALRERKQCTYFTQQLVHLCTSPKDGIVNHKILSEVCTHLVQNGFPEKKSEDMTFRKSCISVLDGVTRGLLDHHMSHPDLQLHTDLWRDTADLSHVSFKKFCTHTISLIMSHQPNMKVSDALKRQALWKSGKISDNFKTLYKQLLVPFDNTEVVEMLHRILEKQEVNWQTLLSFLAMFLVCFPSAGRDIQEYVSKILTESLEAGDMENTIVAFLLARQSCSEGVHVFPAYPRWFQDMFSSSTTSPAGSKKSFTFLMKFLTELVPYEPADILKVHILHPPVVPVKCRDLWMDYTLLAKTRLADLKVPLEETMSAIYTDQGHASTLFGSCVQAETGVHDVEKAVAVFESSGKLPTTVMEASIFRKPYFVGKFLPALLQPRHLPDIPDSKMKLIEALKKAGKIPSSLFIKYDEDCKRETRQLLEGVFEEEEEDGVEEMMMSPREQLAHRLKQLTDAITSQSTESRVSEIVSIISEKMEAVMCPSPDSMVLASHACVINLCQPALLTPHVQVVDEVLNCVCRTVRVACDVSEQSWLRQLVRMISQHVTLLPALFTRLLTLFSCQNASLSQHHIEGIAAFVVHLAHSLALFPPLLVKKHNGEESHDVSFLPLFLQSLPVGSGKEMLVALTFLVEYLRAVFLNIDASVVDCSGDPTVLPPQLIVMSCLLSWRVFPWARASQWSQSPGAQSGQAPRTRRQETVYESEQDRIDSVMATLLASEKFQEVFKINRPTLEDWVQFELRVAPTLDCLSSLQRQTYHHSMMSHFIVSQRTTSPSDCGDDGGRLQESCAVLLPVLVRALSRSWSEAGSCSMCHGPVHVSLTARCVNQHAAAELLLLLSKLMQSIPAARLHSNNSEREEPWLVEQILGLLHLPAQNDISVLPEAVLRVMLSCPPYLLFTNSPRQQPSVQSVQSTVKFLEEFLVNCAAEGGVLSLDVICHLLQGYMTVIKDCRDKSAMELFEKHPLVILSTLVHWQSVCALVPSLPLSSPWERVAPCLDMMDRFCSEGGQSLSFTNAEPFCLAASLYSSLGYRDRSCEASARKELLQHLHQLEPEAVQCLSGVLMISLSDSSICSPSLPHKADSRLQWLSELWELFPHLVNKALNSESKIPTLGHCLMSDDLVPFTEVACLRCVASLVPEKIVGEKGVVQTVVRLYARLCERFDNEHTPQQSADVGVMLQLARMVVTLLRLAPLSALQVIKEDEVKGCGLEAYRVHQQRLKSRT